MREMIQRYVDFSKLWSSPAPLLISAANVETGVLETFFLLRHFELRQ